MKQLTSTLLFLATSIFSFAQTPFTEKTVQDMNKSILADYPKYLNEFASPDFVLSNAQGQLMTFEQLKAAIDLKAIEWTISDLKVKQFGKIAIATGINKHTMMFAKQGILYHYNVRFTYNYEFKNGKWMWLHAQHTNILPVSTIEDETAIKKTLDDVDIAFNNGDKEGVINAWKNDPKITFIGSNSDGRFNVIAQDYESLKKSISTYVTKPTGARGVKSNYRFNFKDNIVIVEFDQVTTLANGAKSLSHNINILEKVGDSWKAIAASHHGFNDPSKEDNPEEIAKQWIAEYSKDNKLFFVKNCSDDFIASNAGIDGGKFFGREFIEKRADGKPSDTETTINKVFKSGNLAVVIGTLIWHNKQADGSDKPNKVISTMIMQKKDGKWWYAGHHLSPLKEE